MEKTVLVTGASAGIAKATAIYLAQSGYNVYGAARRVEKMQDLKDYGIKPIALDITLDESIEACVEMILKEAGSVEVLVNNAGFGSEGAIEDITMQDAKYQMEVNVFGAIRLTQLVLPRSMLFRISTTVLSSFPKEKELHLRHIEKNHKTFFFTRAVFHMKSG